MKDAKIGDVVTITCVVEWVGPTMIDVKFSDKFRNLLVPKDAEYLEKPEDNRPYGCKDCEEL